MCSHPQKVITTFDAGLPAITGSFGGVVVHSPGYGAFHRELAYNTDIHWNTMPFPDGGIYSFDANRCSKVYGRSTTVQPSALTVNYFIRAK